MGKFVNEEAVQTQKTNGYHPAEAGREGDAVQTQPKTEQSQGLIPLDFIANKEKAANMGAEEPVQKVLNAQPVQPQKPANMFTQSTQARQENFPSIGQMAKRDFFRVKPTAEQATMMGASPISENEAADRVNQMKIDAIKRQQMQSKPIDENSPTAGLDSIYGHWTSPQEEEKLRKASVARQKIMAVGDALRHIGNIWNTSRYAPSQQFNSPVQEERTRYQQEKALRDQANQRIMSYEQAKAAQDLKAKQLENEMKYRNESNRLRQQELDRLDKQYGLNVDKFDWKKQLDQMQFDLKKQLDEHKISVDEYNAQSRRITALASQMRAAKTGGGGGGGKGMDEYTVTTDTQYITDPKSGQRTGTKSVKKRTVNRKDGGSSTTTTTTEKKKKTYGTPTNGGKSGNGSSGGYKFGTIK